MHLGPGAPRRQWPQMPLAKRASHAPVQARARRAGGGQQRRLPSEPAMRLIRPGRAAQAVATGDAVTVGQAWQQVASGDVAPDVDSLNTLLKCRPHPPPQGGPPPPPPPPRAGSRWAACIAVARAYVIRVCHEPYGGAKWSPPRRPSPPGGPKVRVAGTSGRRAAAMRLKCGSFERLRPPGLHVPALRAARRLPRRERRRCKGQARPGDHTQTSPGSSSTAAACAQRRAHNKAPEMGAQPRGCRGEGRARARRAGASAA